MTDMRKAGFTLVELLIVIVILSLLMTITVSIVVGVIDRARVSRTKSLVQMIHHACVQYRDDFGLFPHGDSSKDLHLYLGRTRTTVLSYRQDGAPMTMQKPPYLEFKKDMLEGDPSSTYPDPPREIIDAWQRPLHYRNPGVRNPKAVDVWSDGPETDSEEDDIGNWGEGS